MKQCKKCKEVKFWFQFHTEFRGIYTAVYDVCKKCANKLKQEAVDDFVKQQHLQSMKEYIINYLPWLLSAITIYSMLLAGNKRKAAWLFGLINQFLWLIWIINVGSWGLLPMNIALWVVYFRNYIKWN